ncbi:Uncharacterised protein [Burkholderia pseudomallei]|nr:Uncharacterised protein [Burkholderia pseudomallei]
MLTEAGGAWSSTKMVTGFSRLTSPHVVSHTESFVCSADRTITISRRCTTSPHRLSPHARQPRSIYVLYLLAVGLERTQMNSNRWTGGLGSIGSRIPIAWLNPSVGMQSIHQTVQRLLRVPLSGACPHWMCTEDGQMMCLSGLGAQGVPIALAIYPPLRRTPGQAFRQRLAQLKKIRRELCLSRGIFLIEISALQNLVQPALERYVAVFIETAAVDCRNMSESHSSAGDAALADSFAIAADILEAAVKRQAARSRTSGISPSQKRPGGH